MKTAALGLLAALACAEAHAADGPHCVSLAKAQKMQGRGTAIMALTPAQFHFMQGMYVALPSTPDGLPPGDGALFLTRDNSDEGLILWTRGTLVCNPLPIAKASKLAKILADVKAGHAEGDDL